MDGWVVFIVALFICTLFIGAYPIYILDESRNAEAAREMFISGNYIVPYFNGVLRTDKPPLHYYIMTLGYQIFGINAFGARFFSGVFGALTILVCYKSVKRHLSTLHGQLTVGVLLAALFFVQEFHLAVPDPYLIFFIATALFSFFEFQSTQHKKWLLVAYSCIGLGILTKGPIAIVIPGLSLFVFLILSKQLRWKIIFSYRPILGLLWALAIVLPWYYWVHEATQGAWTKGFFLDHNVNRFQAGKEGHGGLFILTPLFVVLGLLPFSVIAPQALKEAWKQGAQLPLLRFAFSVTIVTLVFFSIASTKLPNYPMPCYPFLGILLATFLYKVKEQPTKVRSVEWSFGVLTFISIALPIAGFVALSLEKQFFEIRWISLFIAILSITAPLSWWYYRKMVLKKAFLTLVVGWILMTGLLHGLVYPILTKQSPTTLASEVIDQDAEVVVFQRFDSAFPFNFNRTFEVVYAIEELRAYLEEHPKALVLTNTRDKGYLKQLGELQLLLEQKALFENHTTRIYSSKAIID
ncbi:MAG: glycosyltransferase family 39 protein [Bacteroidota bacterium]